MKNSEYGIRIKGSQNNNVYKNCIKNNERGIYCCCGAKSNYIYNNTLLNNSVRNAEENEGLTNIWYDYPNGNGNYWGDYTGIDKNHDGRGDTPYTIADAGNKDMNPLMTPPLDVPCNQ
jgi:nitrous oxidase accessory protein